MRTFGDPDVRSISLALRTPGVDPDRHVEQERAVRVLVEPLYLGVAAALALDAGWGSVELAPSNEQPPIPLVSYEQRPTRPGGRCRVRGDVRDVCAALDDPDVLTLLGSMVVARPLAAQLARGDSTRIDFVPVASAGAVSSDAWAVCGLLIRLLLEESDVPCVLDDAAGIAVAITEDAHGGLAASIAAGRRWRRHLERGGHEDDMRIATAVDSVGVVPRVTSAATDGVVLEPW